MADVHVSVNTRNLDVIGQDGRKCRKKCRQNDLVKLEFTLFFHNIALRISYAKYYNQSILKN